LYGETPAQSRRRMALMRANSSLASANSTRTGNVLLDLFPFSQYTIGVVFCNTIDLISSNLGELDNRHPITINIVFELAALGGAGRPAAIENYLKQTRP
jgi:hypothetical protein